MDKIQGSPRQFWLFHCSGAKNGFAISSNPSTGFRTVIVGPRRTANPRVRICGSGTEAGSTERFKLLKRRTRLTLQFLCNIIQYKVQKLIVSFQDTSNCWRVVGEIIHPSPNNKAIPSRPPVNFTLILSSTYLDRSRIASRRGFSACGAFFA
jgi:hypothetical protein